MRRGFVIFAAVAMVMTACEIEAELPIDTTGTVTVLNDRNAAGGAFATIEPSSSATYVAVPLAPYAAYPSVFWIRVRCHTGSESLVATVDEMVGGTSQGTETALWDLGCGAAAGGEWFWDVVTDGSPDPAQFDLSNTAAEYQLTLSATDEAVDVDRVWIGPIGSEPPADRGNYGGGVKNLVLEAEDGVGGAPHWELFSHPEAHHLTGSNPSPGSDNAVRSTGASATAGDFGDGTLSYQFTAQVSGLYQLWMRVRALDPGADAVHVRVTEDGEAPGSAQLSELVARSAWTWDAANVWFFPVRYQLEEGTSYTLEVQADAAGTEIDRIQLTNGLHYSPAIKTRENPVDVWGAGGVFDFLTENNHQYIAYYGYDADDGLGRVTVAHRSLDPVTPWTRFALEEEGAEYRFHEGFDTHNTLTMALDSKEHLHVSGNMHVEPMHYWRTSVPHDVTSLAVADMPTPVPPAGREGPDGGPRITYPVFSKGPNPQDLYFTYREGVSSNGETYLMSYDVDEERWDGIGPNGTVVGDVATPLLARCAQAGCGNQNAYHELEFDGANWHLAWVWRSPDANGRSRPWGNHDLSYAWSPNLSDWYLAGETPGAPGVSPQAWPMTYLGDPAAGTGGVDPKIVNDAAGNGALQPGDGVDPDLATRLGDGLHNSLFDLSIVEGVPVIASQRLVYPAADHADSIARVWSHDGAAWHMVEPLPNDSCTQTTMVVNDVEVDGGPFSRARTLGVTAEDDGSYSLGYARCAGAGGTVNLELDVTQNPVIVDADPNTPEIDPRPFRPASGTQALQATEPIVTNRDLCGSTGSDPALDEETPVITIHSRGDETAEGYFLRYNRVKSVEFKPPSWCPQPEDPPYALQPSPMRVYRLHPSP